MALRINMILTGFVCFGTCNLKENIDRSSELSIGWALLSMKTALSSQHPAAAEVRYCVDSPDDIEATERRCAASNWTVFKFNAELPLHKKPSSQVVDLSPCSTRALFNRPHCTGLLVDCSGLAGQIYMRAVRREYYYLYTVKKSRQRRGSSFEDENIDAFT